MGSVWSHPENDQRSEVREWLPAHVEPGAKIVDIGSGDGYYTKGLRPVHCAIVEPDRLLRRSCMAGLRGSGIRARAFQTLDRLYRSVTWRDADVILLVHSLLYLSFDEIQLTHHLARGRACAMIFPNPVSASTVEFEKAIGCEWSRERIAKKEALFGEPSQRRVANVHFRFVPHTREADIAFVISHLLLRREWSDAVLSQALAHLDEHRTSWRASDGSWKLPQPQVMEWWQRV